MGVNPNLEIRNLLKLGHWIVDCRLGVSTGIGFVLHNRGAAGQVVCWNWVARAVARERGESREEKVGKAGRGEIGFPDVHRDFAALSGGIGFVLLKAVFSI